MPDETGSHEDKTNSNQQETNAQRKNILHGVERYSEKQNSQEDGNDPKGRQKPSLPVRVLRVLWRRRKWRQIRKKAEGSTGPHWAEITVVILTCGILIGTFTQAYIYWKQAGIMQRSLEQNERSIMLGIGQLAVATRNAKNAEQTLEEMRLQREIGRLEKGGANIQIDGISMFHEGNSVSAGIVLRNDGKRDAGEILICTRIEFRISPVAWDQNQCDPSNPAQPNRLRPFITSQDVAKVVSAVSVQIPVGYSPDKSADIYVSGVIKYRDSTGAVIRQAFCKRVSAKQVFDSPAGVTVGKGYAFDHPKDCPIGSLTT
jgi:hypothetical protein